MTGVGGGMPWEAVAVSGLDQGVVLFDRSGMRHANAAAARILGLDADQMLGRALDEARFHIFDDDGNEVRGHHLTTESVLRTGIGQERRIQLRGPDGGSIWLVARSVPVTFEGRPAVVTTFTDVTDHKRADDAVRAGEQRLQEILDAVDASVFVKDLDGRYLFVNRSFERELGRSRQLILGRRAADIAGDAAADAERQDLEVIRSGEPVSALVSRDQRSFLTTKSPLRDESGEVRALVGVSTNVTAERQEAEAAGRLAAIVQASGDAIVALDRDLRVTSWNPAAELLLGLPAHEVVGRSYLDVAVLPEYREMVDEMLRDVLGGETRVFEVEVARPDSSAVTFLVSLNPIRASDGGVTGVAAVNRDITGERAAVAEREALASQVAHMQRLEGLGQLAGGVAHDFNNLLASITLTAELLLPSLSSGSAEQQHAQRILDIASRATDLTRQLLVFARNEPPRRDRIELNALVRRADDMLGRTLGPRVERRLEVSDLDLVVEADPAQLEQVVVNLVLNARDAMPDGGTVRIATGMMDLDGHDTAPFRTGSSGPHAVLSVSDTGIGMDEATRLHAFEPFFTTKPAGRGTGLGLALVFEVAARAGGGVWIHSEPGQGTVVRVALPLRDAAPEPAPAVPVARDLKGKGRLVVVAEDEPALLTVTERLLTKAGFVVRAYADAAAVLADMPTWDRAPDLLITDVVMPDVSGPRLVELVRESYPDVPVLLMSGYTAGLVPHAGTVTDLELLEKPFTAASLAARVHQALERGRDEV